MIETSSDSEKLRRLFQADGEPPRSEGDCPPPDRLWAAAALELPAAERREVIGHTAGCPACAEDFRVVAQMVRAAAESNSEGKGVVVAGPWLSRPKTRGLWASLAATLFVATLLAGLFGILPGTKKDDVYRGDDRQQILSLLGSEAVLLRGTAVLRWQGPAGARYRLTLMDEDLRLLEEVEDLEQPSYRIEEEILAPFPRGGVFHWRVDATLEGGGKLTSPTFQFRLE